MDEVTGGGFKERVLMVKGNKYCHDKSRGDLTDGRRAFLLLVPRVFYQTLLLLLRKGDSSQTRGGEWKFSRHSQGSFITVSGAATPVGIH